MISGGQQISMYDLLAKDIINADSNYNERSVHGTQNTRHTEQLKQYKCKSYESK